ncbi:hypothetical protein FE257_003401 [Aspergillus nanangensis]|uniref:CRIB domain-containing protein n=1 Tax=Aspergillus nanangensis TaxID=2582783 RepID=A0AAD4GNM6_ASPNN|nr:hypothetical protein FE257_003401 [Aspergillus nanangensis]
MHTSHLSMSTSRGMGQEQERPPTGASTSDHPEHTVHMRSRSTAHAQSPKRLSVFSGRSRSNTTNSTTSSSRRSPASSMTSADAASLPSSNHSHEERSGSATGIRPERQESMTKSLFTRGSRILRRQGSKFNIVATVDEADEAEREKPRFEVADIFTRHHRSRQSNAQDNIKSLISDPFDFHHLTHTSPSHFQELDQTRENDLVTEFSAIRASQRPVTGLKGIRAEDLHFRDFSSEDLTDCANCTSCGTTMAGDDHSGPGAMSPPASPGTISTPVSPKKPNNAPARESRAFENFSRPVSRIHKYEATAPPPRAGSPRLAASPELSEPAPRAIDEILGLSSPQTYPEHVHSHTNDSRENISLSNIQIEGMFPAANLFPDKEPTHARAGSVPFSALSSDLDDVPEEEEIAATYWHDSPESNVEHPASGTESQLGSPLHATNAEPLGAPKSRLSVYVTEKLSLKLSEALGSPTLPQFREHAEAPEQERARSQSSGRQSAINPKPTYETIYEAWDADIDYCYEHAAESNSNFDWARKSLEEPQHGKVEVSITMPLDDSLPRGQENRLPLSVHHLSTSTLPTPDLDPSPSRSLPSSHFASTPSTIGYEGELTALQKDGDYFQPVSSSMFPSALGKNITHDTLYEEYLAADAESDRHFSFCSQGVIQPMEHPVSPRSSFSPISKCNSQESLILSRAASIVRKHRSSVSTVSVPELVHSLANSRELPPMEHVPSSERLSSGFGRPDSASHHRQTKSLARELDAYRIDGNTAPETTGPMTCATPFAHDRTRSTSEVDSIPLVARATKASAHRRKGRTSYSLFPTPPMANSNGPLPS